MRVFLLLTLTGLLALAACSKSDITEERWLETSQGQEVIVFKHDTEPSLPGSTVDNTEGSFYFQTRKLPDNISRANESGIYFYTIKGDSLLLKTSQKNYYFKMAEDRKSFTIGLFFFPHDGLAQQLVFKKQ
jgi:hypothetical protein